jgi:hypothetical protein
MLVTPFRVVAFLVAAAMLAASPRASAQGNGVSPANPEPRGRDQAGRAPQAGSSEPVKTSADTGPKWEIEGHAGLSATSDQAHGSGSLPTTATVVQGMISASTLYFGDGARLFNQNENAVFGQAASTIVPLDAVLAGPAIRRQKGTAFGIRVERALNRRLAIEMSGDASFDHLAFEPGALTALEATRGSFKTALGRTLSMAPLDSAATSVATLNDHQSARQLFAAGALILSLKESGRTIPYLSAGGGIAFNGGNLPTATLVGHYELGTPSQLFGTDTVALSYTQATRVPLISGGGGFKYLLTQKWGIRLDARARFYRNSTTNLVDVTPAMLFVSTGQPFPLVNTGALQFATTAPLNGASVQGATTFKGSGVQTQFLFAVGFFRRL